MVEVEALLSVNEIWVATTVDLGIAGEQRVEFSLSLEDARVMRRRLAYEIARVEYRMMSRGGE